MKPNAEINDPDFNVKRIRITQILIHRTGISFTTERTFKKKTSVADPELFPGSGILVPDPDPAKSERVDK